MTNQPPPSPTKADLLTAALAKLEQERQRRRDERSEATRAHDMRMLATGQFHKLDLKVAFDGWLEWMDDPEMHRPLGKGTVPDLTPAAPPPRYVKNIDGELQKG